MPPPGGRLNSKLHNRWPDGDTSCNATGPLAPSWPRGAPKAIGLLLFVGGVLVFFESSTPAAGTLTPSALSYVILYSTPLLSGAACALLAGRRRFGILLSLGVAGATTFTLIDRFWRSLELAVAGGIQETEWLFGISLVAVPLLVLIGGWMGHELRARLLSRVPQR